MHYEMSAPVVVGEQVWYSVVRQRADGSEEMWAVSCPIDMRPDPDRRWSPRRPFGLRERECWWQWVRPPGDEPPRVVSQRERRRERAELERRFASLTPIDRVENGTLTDTDLRVPDDDSPYDELKILVREGWTIRVSMTSIDFDTYLWLIGPDGSSLVQDDDGGEGLNSRFTYRAERSGEYTIRANSYDGAGRGAYVLHIEAFP